MSFGQYSAMGGLDRSKTDMLSIVARQGFEVTWSRKGKGGKNRLHFRCADGSEGFLLHETVVALLSADKTRLTLNDGGWATPTTRTSWGDACSAFGIRSPLVWGARPKADHCIVHITNTYENRRTILFDRKVTLTVPEFELAPECAHETLDCPMIRATIDGERSLTVRYLGLEVVSDSGDKIAIGPGTLMMKLHEALDVARLGNGRFTMRIPRARQFEALWDTARPFMGYEIVAGRGARSLFIGCHEFKTADVRAMLRRLEFDYPAKAKVARQVAQRRRKREAAARKQREAQQAAQQAA